MGRLVNPVASRVCSFTIWCFKYVPLTSSLVFRENLTIYYASVSITEVFKMTVKSRNNQKDFYQEVTNKIITALEQGVKPWVCPWDSSSALPASLFTGNTYSGINILLLWSAMFEKGFNSSNWITYKQVRELGGNVRKGETGTTITFYKPWKKISDDGEEEIIPLLKTFTVFNFEQTENLPEPNTTTISNDIKRVEHIENAIQSTGIDIEHRSSKAFYSPQHDVVNLPKFELFKTADDYYSTAWHELVHATGHKSRLDRKIKNRFGDKDYAFEELVAELGSAFCCASLGINGEVQHESYIASWLEKLRGDKRYIFKAASQAAKAHQLLLPQNKKS